MKISEPKREVTDPDDEDCEFRSRVAIRIILGGQQQLGEKLDPDPHKSKNSGALMAQKWSHRGLRTLTKEA
jgi:hypothetical protein